MCSRSPKFPSPSDHVTQGPARRPYKSESTILRCCTRCGQIDKIRGDSAHRSVHPSSRGRLDARRSGAEPVTKIAAILCAALALGAVFLGPRATREMPDLEVYWSAAG